MGLAISRLLVPANQDAGSRPPAISHAHRNLARVACALAACALTVWINAPVAIPPLVALVRDGTDDQKVSAASALRYLAWRPDNSEAIRRAGGIPPLVALVRDGNDDQKVSAADALRILARGSDNYVVLAIAKAGGIPPLVALLRDGNDAQKATAARALGNLEYKYCDSGDLDYDTCHMDYDDDEEYFDHRIAIAKAGGVPPLVALVRDGNDEQKESAAGALRNLAWRPDNSEAIRRAGGIPPLVALVRDGNAKQRESAVGALGDLAVNDDNKIRIEEAGVIPPLMALVRDGNAKQRDSAAGALENLAVNDNKILIAEVEALAALVRDGNADQKVSATDALRILARRPEAVQKGDPTTLWAGMASIIV